MLGACSTMDDLVVPTSQYKAVLDNRQQAMDALSQANSCCANVANFPYTAIPADFDSLVVIDGSSPVYQFADGKSFFAAYQLPQNSGDLRISVAAQIDKTVFKPKIVMLDAQFRVTRVIDDSIFHYEPQKLLDGDRIEGVFSVDRTYIGNPNNETYMILYTPYDKLGEMTKTISAAKLMAKSMAVVDPGMPDPEIPHSPWGLIKISLADVSSETGLANIFKPTYGPQDTAYRPKSAEAVAAAAAPNKLQVVVPAELTAAAATTATVAANNAVVAPNAQVVAQPVANSSATMLAETEQMYNQMILQAVQAGDIGKAMTLAAEAERAGSASAKNTFIQAVKQSQH
ncbi:MalM family protein [Pseudaeromonas paramecii]|uniref:MalM family protein n=2 Tax=Pseudaeromonas paramecii TaxID=2138166 RepID=A0ABP8Q5X5_9GAMM